MIHMGVPIKLVGSTSPMYISLLFGLVLPFMYRVVVSVFVSVMVLLRLDSMTIVINWIATYVMHQHIQATECIHSASLLGPEVSDLLNICHACTECPPNEGDCSGMLLSVQTREVIFVNVPVTFPFMSARENVAINQCPTNAFMVVGPLSHGLPSIGLIEVWIICSP